MCERSLTGGAGFAKVVRRKRRVSLQMEGTGGGIRLLSRPPSRRRTIGIAGLLLAGSLALAAPASGQSDGTTTTPPTTTVPGAPVGAPDLSLTSTIRPDGRATIPWSAPFQVRRAIKAANHIHRRKYVWGGGHRRFKSKGYDCSGAVSYVLHAAGALSYPLVSGQLASWGAPGPGSWITVYANRTHTYMVIAGLRYDTSPLGEWLNQGRGPRWRYTLRVPTGFAIRHYPGL
jgi:hypothetical protein